MLTEEEKDKLREYLCRTYSGFTKRLTPQVLKEYAQKTDAEIRAIFTKQETDELARLQTQKVAIEVRIKELEA